MNIKEKCERTKVNAFYHVANKSATNLCLILDWFSYNVHVNWWLYHMIWKFWQFFWVFTCISMNTHGPTSAAMGRWSLTHLFAYHIWKYILMQIVHLTCRFFRICGDKRSELFELFKKHDQLSSGVTSDFLQLIYI
jgi:hypothetical protein